ncbi:MAG: hypothetical protein RL885_21735 [Planctomycetota bacterium]
MAILVLLLGLGAPLIGLSPPVEDEIPVLVLKRSDYSQTLERNGTFIPAVASEIEIDPKAYSGALRWREILPHGTLVRAGDRVGRFEMESIEEQIEAAKREVDSARRSLQNTKIEIGLEEASEELGLERTRAERDDAARSLEGWLKHELDFARRSAEMSQQSFEDNIQDQKDELAQLESMYREDELTDATEEIVLQRSRRSLARSLARFELSKEQRAYSDQEIPHQTAGRRRNLAAREQALHAAVKKAEIAREGRQLRIEAAERALKEKEEKLAELEHDRGLLDVVAPRDGMLLHGGVEDYHPGKVAPRHEVGSAASPRQAILTVADPDRFEVACDVPESKVLDLRSGQVATVTSALLPGQSRMGKLRLERFPSPRSASGAENSYEALVILTEPLPGIVAGQRAKVTLETETQEDVFVLPRSAIFTSGSDAYCWVSQDGAFQKIPVTVGRGDAQQAIVRGELKAGQSVLLGEPNQ